MRLKVITARTVAEAMAEIRRDLGPDAVIISTEPEPDGRTRVVAAQEDEPTHAPPLANAATPGSGSAGAKVNGARSMAELLEFHGVPQEVMISLMTEASEAGRRSLADRLAAVFRFASLADRQRPGPILLTGPPGTGKTLTAAKLAARAVFAGLPVRIITTDIVRAGGIEQLSAFTRLLNLELQVADGPEALRTLLARNAVATSPPAQTIIDTAGASPRLAADLSALAELTQAAQGEAVLVMAAGGDVEESAEIAQAFAAVNCTRLIATRVDTARRLGGLLAAALAGGLAFAEVSATPNVAHGLAPLRADTLAMLLSEALPHPQPTESLS